jgi:hypothetical protein
VTRPVHYAAAGRTGLQFPCLSAATRRWLASKVETWHETPNRKWLETTMTEPAPLKHTSLDRVTCPDCWREIAAMAQGRGLR